LEGLDELRLHEQSEGLTKEDLIKKLDEALLGAKVSPSLLFREADKDRDGTI
jgi:hypothetical protein